MNLKSSGPRWFRWRWLLLLVVLVAGIGLALPALRGPRGGRARHAGTPHRPGMQSEVSRTDASLKPVAANELKENVLQARSDGSHDGSAERSTSADSLESTDNQASETETNATALVSTSVAPVADKAVPLGSEAWTRFRGPNGTGVSSDSGVATEWSDSKNVKWKTTIPGAGSSSPIVTDRYIFISSYSGYGAGASQGSIETLKRNLSCIDRSNGKILWTKSVDAVQPEDAYRGMGVPEHGYATNTPVTDGTSVFAFFGKSGVVAYDMEGKELWKTSVGTESGNRGWGTAASLILYKNLVIVNAAEESQSIRALDKSTGNEVWKATASALELAYGTPVIARVDDQRDDLVIAVPGEVWGLNPDTGKLAWYAETTLTGNLSPSVILDGDVVYVFGGYRSSGSMAVRIGGKGDVSKTHVVWTSRNSSYVSTPVLNQGNLYWIDDRGTYYCASAKTGELLHRSRVTGIQSRDRPVYASPIAINGTLYFQTRHDGVFVTSSKPELDVLHQNRFESDSSMFNSTPAVYEGELFLRSDTALYCIASETK
ncbi:MAG: PQQ-binding-like beta-propeller repeat protein [Pirellula sp.]